MKSSSRRRRVLGLGLDPQAQHALLVGGAGARARRRMDSMRMEETGDPRGKRPRA
jgi:hypothetical protein